MNAKAKDQQKSILIDNLEVSRMLGVNADTWRKRVERGQAPMPFTRMGARTYYRRADVRHFLKTGGWPAGMTFHRRKAASVDPG